MILETVAFALICIMAVCAIGIVAALVLGGAGILHPFRPARDLGFLFLSCCLWTGCGAGILLFLVLAVKVFS